MHNATLLLEGFMALKPSSEVVDMFEWFASKADFSRKEEDLIAVQGGWGGGGSWPTNSGCASFSVLCLLIILILLILLLFVLCLFCSQKNASTFRDHCIYYGI